MPIVAVSQIAGWKDVTLVRAGTVATSLCLWQSVKLAGGPLSPAATGDCLPNLTKLHCTALHTALHCTLHCTAHCPALHTALHTEMHCTATAHRAALHTELHIAQYTLIHWLHCTLHYTHHCKQHCTIYCTALQKCNYCEVQCMGLL